MARLIVIVTIALIDFGAPGTWTAIWVLVQLSDRPLSLHARLLAAHRKLESAKHEVDSLSEATSAEIKRHILARLRFQILACLSSIKRWRSIADNPEEAVEAFCELSFAEDFEVLDSLMYQRREILAMSAEVLHPAYLEWLEHRRMNAQRRFDRFYTLWVSEQESSVNRNGSGSFGGLVQTAL